MFSESLAHFEGMEAQFDNTVTEVLIFIQLEYTCISSHRIANNISLQVCINFIQSDSFSKNL